MPTTLAVVMLWRARHARLGLCVVRGNHDMAGKSALGQLRLYSGRNAATTRMGDVNTALLAGQVQLHPAGKINQSCNLAIQQYNQFNQRLNKRITGHIAR